jgi:hypothetical protein
MPAWLCDTIGKSDALRLFAGHAPPGQNHVHGAAVTDEPRQTHRPKVHQRNAETPAIDAEGRIARRDAQITPQGKFQSAGDGMAFDGRDDRLLELHTRWPHGGITPLDAVAAPAGSGLLQIEPGTEGATSSREDRHGERSVSIEATQRFGERAGGRRVDGIAGGRPVDRDDRGRAVGRDEQGSLLVHRGTIARLARADKPIFSC